jgi:hypothetical protein
MHYELETTLTWLLIGMCEDTDCIQVNLPTSLRPRQNRRLMQPNPTALPNGFTAASSVLSLHVRSELQVIPTHWPEKCLRKRHLPFPAAEDLLAAGVKMTELPKLMQINRWASFTEHSGARLTFSPRDNSSNAAAAPSATHLPLPHQLTANPRQCLYPQHHADNAE